MRQGWCQSLLLDGLRLSLLWLPFRGLWLPLIGGGHSGAMMGNILDSLLQPSNFISQRLCRHPFQLMDVYMHSMMVGSLSMLFNNVTISVEGIKLLLSAFSSGL